MTALLAVVFLEAASFSCLSLMEGRLFSRKEFSENRRAIIESSGNYDIGLCPVQGPIEERVIHPYMGYVSDHPTRQDPYGFLNGTSLIRKRESDKVVLAITGGSVARQIFLEGMDVLVRRLKTDKSFQGKTVIPVCFALGGYKQPQQLMALNYLLSLGAEFDVVINLDGFNEAVSSANSNYPQKIFPFFPFNWAARIDLFSTPRAFEAAAAAMSLKKNRVQLAKICNAPLLRGSYLMNLAWSLWDRILETRFSEAQKAFADTASSANSYAVSGPFRPYKNKDQLYDDIARVWKRSSLLMRALCASNGAAYFHILQPHRFVVGGKPLNNEERKHPSQSALGVQRVTEAIYPRFGVMGKELGNEGVFFKDATQIFSNRPETLYRDAVHLNKEGIRIFAEQIADFIIETNRARG